MGQFGLRQLVQYAFGLMQFALRALFIRLRQRLG